MAVRAPRTWSGPNRTGTTQVNLLEKVGRRVLSVTRIEEITPRYRRVYLTGDSLRSDGFPFVHLAPTDHVKIVFPQPESGELVMPVVGERGLQPPEDKPRPIFRDYTVRGWLPESHELILEFVVHGHGVASNWVTNAKPGDQLGVMGPRGNIYFPENYSWYLLAGDEAALPALTRFAEELPASAGAHILIEVDDHGEVRHLGERPGIDVTWVLRSEAGDDGLVNAVRAVALPEHDEWLAFAAGEAGTLKSIRDYLRLDRGLPRERVVVDGYWKRGLANLDHHSINLDED